MSGADKMSREVAAITQTVYSAADRVVFKAEGTANGHATSTRPTSEQARKHMLWLSPKRWLDMAAVPLDRVYCIEGFGVDDG